MCVNFSFLLNYTLTHMAFVTQKFFKRLFKTVLRIIPPIQLILKIMELLLIWI